MRLLYNNPDFDANIAIADFSVQQQKQNSYGRWKNQCKDASIEGQRAIDRSHSLLFLHHSH